jgi:4-aminobutyrate aminotransferase/(S)-3-amino-2-methylpropionate transaminase
MSHIRLKTPIPGPRSREILARRQHSMPTGLAHSTEVVVESATGSLVRDVDGNTLIDMTAGIGMLNAGHCPAGVVAAVRQQAEKLIHACALVATYEPYVALAEKLNQLTPGDFPKKTLLSNSGAEAVENAVKFARCYTGRPAIVCFEGAYHGRTLLTASLTSKYSLFKKGFGPFAPEVYRLPAPYPYHRPKGMSTEDYVEWCCRQLENAFIAQVAPEAVAAFIIEPVQGEAGFIPMPAAFLKKMRSLCDQHGIVLIADEVQSGFGRTGRLFAIEHSDVVPDLLVMAKSLASGLPISAVTGRAEILDAAHPGGVGGTYSGSPVACAAALATIEIVEKPEFLKRAGQIGHLMTAELKEWEAAYSLVGETRGLGAMQAVEFVLDRERRTPAPEQTLRILRRAVEGGLLLIRAGLYSNCIRLLPPLIIADDQLKEALQVLRGAVEWVQKQP